MCSNGTRAPRTFRVTVVSDQLLTAYLVYTTVANILVSHERDQGAATFAVKGSATVRGHDAVVFDDVFSDDSAAITAASSIASPLLSLLSNEFEQVELDASTSRSRPASSGGARRLRARGSIPTGPGRARPSG